MRNAGYKSIETAKENGSWFILDEVEELILPKDLKKEFDKREGAIEYYDSLSKSAKKILLSWIVLTKKMKLDKKELLK
jgi:uncharacterized protein YdeI (YjbR/CyaY-like superfamily)